MLVWTKKAAADALLRCGFSASRSRILCSAAGIPRGFVEQCKDHGPQIMVGSFSRFDYGGFDGCLGSSLEVTHVNEEEKTVKGKLVVGKELRNTYGALHGGVTCTIVDVMGTMAILAADPSRAGVSIDLGVQFTRAAKVGQEVDVVGQVIKYGRKLAFTSVELIDPDNGAVIASGHHTKAFP